LVNSPILVGSVPDIWLNERKSLSMDVRLNISSGNGPVISLSVTLWG
jgi:hypothetical protein